MQFFFDDKKFFLSRILWLFKKYFKKILKNLQNIIGWEKNFLFSDKKIFCGREDFFWGGKIFAVWKYEENKDFTENKIENKNENLDKKNRISETEVDELWEIIEKNSEQTKKAANNLFKNFENRVFTNNSFESNIIIPELRVRSFEWDAWYITVWDKWSRFKNNISKKIKIHTDGINKEYETICEREFYYKSLKENLEKEVLRLENWIARSQEVLDNIWWFKSSLLTVYEKWVIWLAWDKIKEKFHKREAKKQIEKVKDTLKKVEEKEIENNNRKTELEDFIWTKTEKVDWILNSFDDIFNDYGFEKDEIKNFKEFLNEWWWYSKKSELTDFLKENTDFYEKLEKLNWNDKFVFEKLLEAYRSWVNKEIKEFNNIKDKFNNFEENRQFYQEKKEKSDASKILNEKLNDKNFTEIQFKDKEEFTKSNWKIERFHWNYEWKKIILKDWKEKFLFIEKWEKNKEVDWSDESAVLIFDEDEWFVEVDDKFLELKENKGAKNETEEKISNISYIIEDKISELKDDLKNKKEIYKILNSYEKLWKRFKNIWKKVNEQKIYFDKYFKTLEKKDSNNIEKKAKADAKKSKSVNNFDFVWKNDKKFNNNLWNKK